MPHRSLTRLYKDEFSGYALAKFQQDLLASLTVAAIALPLALAFGVASGASVAAGLVTAYLWQSAWPDIIVGGGIGWMNADAAREVWHAAREEHKAAES